MKRFVRFCTVTAAFGAALTSASYGDPGSTQDATALEGGVWRLIASSIDPPDLAVAGMTASFDGSRIAGFSGVNRYAGPYSADADGAFGAGPLASTLMAGPEPLMEAEAAFLRLLQAAERFSVSGTELTLRTADGDTLVFGLAEQVGLSGTAWTVTGYNNGQDAVVGLEPGSELAVEFGEDGGVLGSGGINRFRGSYESGERTLEIGPLASTRMAGAPGLMQQESAFLSALESSTSWEVLGGVLYLRGDGGSIRVIATANAEGIERRLP